MLPLLLAVCGAVAALPSRGGGELEARDGRWWELQALHQQGLALTPALLQQVADAEKTGVVLEEDTEGEVVEEEEEEEPEAEDDCGKGISLKDYMCRMKKKASSETGPNLDGVLGSSRPPVDDISMKGYMERMKSKGSVAGNPRDGITPSPSVMPSATPSNSPPPPTEEPTPSASPQSPSESPSPTPTPTESPTPPGTPSSTPSATMSARSQTPSASPSDTPAGVSASPSTSFSPFPPPPSGSPWPQDGTASDSVQPTPSQTETASTSFSPSLSISESPSTTPSETPSTSITASTSISLGATRTATRSPSTSQSLTPSSSITPTPSTTPFPRDQPVIAVAPDVPATFKITIAERQMYAAETAATWRYDNERGADVWGLLDTTFVTCEASLQQSPIDLTAFRMGAQMATRLHHHYSMVRAVVRNTGNYLRVVFADGCSVSYGERQYALIHAQIHTPSEHTINGNTYPAEIQYVHRNDEGDLAVVSVLYEEGLDSPVLDRILEVAPSEPGVADLPQPINIIDAIPKEVTEHKDSQVYDGAPTPRPRPGETPRATPEPMRVSYPHYEYDGSLTTPPCTDGVRWFVWAKPDQASREQLEQLRGMFNLPNARPVQAGNNRIVELVGAFAL